MPIIPLPIFHSHTLVIKPFEPFWAEIWSLSGRGIIAKWLENKGKSGIMFTNGTSQNLTELVDI